MGYYSSLSGKMTFSRPLNRKEAATVQDAKDTVWIYYTLSVETEERETDEGTLTITRVAGIELEESVAQDRVKAYEWQSVLQRMVSALPEDVAVFGYFERIGEESPDMERLYVVGRQVVSVKPTITWPGPTAA